MPSVSVTQSSPVRDGGTVAIPGVKPKDLVGIPWLLHADRVAGMPDAERLQAQLENMARFAEEVLPAFRPA